jgi:hypothetical protein
MATPTTAQTNMNHRWGDKGGLTAEGRWHLRRKLYLLCEIPKPIINRSKTHRPPIINRYENRPFSPIIAYYRLLSPIIAKSRILPKTGWKFLALSRIGVT